MKTIRVFCMAALVCMAVGSVFGQKTLKHVIVDETGKMLVELPVNAYENVVIMDGFKEGWSRIRVGDKYGLFDENGWILEPQDGELILYDGFFVVRSVGKVGVMARDGKWLLEPMDHVYDMLGSGDKVVVLKYNWKYGMMDKTGWVVDPIYDEIQWNSEGMIPFRKGNRCGFIDTEGHMAIKPQYKWVRRFNEGMAGVCVDGKWGFIDKQGTMVIAPAYDNIDCFFEGLASVEVDGKWGFIDKTGKMVIEPRYSNVGIFSEGLAAFVSDESGWGYIDKTGEVVIKPQFESPGCFDETGKAWVRVGDYETGVTGYVDRDGVFTPDETETENSQSDNYDN